MKQRRARLKYTEKAAKYILTELEKGRTLTSICKEEDLPAYRTIQQWVTDDKEGFKERYDQARLHQVNMFIDKMHDIADLPPPVPPEFVKNEHGDMIPLEGTDRKLWVNAENQRRRLQVDTIKFTAAKLVGAMNAKMERGVTIQGDTINIMNYSTPQQLMESDIQGYPDDIEVKQVNFIETTEVN